MTTALFSPPDCQDHLTPPGHPEQVARLVAIAAALAAEEFAELDRQDAPLADERALLRCHPQGHVDRVRDAIPAHGFAQLDADTHVSPGSFRAALRAVGASLAAVEQVVSGARHNAFVACRPPGHHAERERAMGFCLFGNVSIAAKYALDALGLARVAIIDFDAHHGNGTQDLMWDEPRALYCSSHQVPLYPGTGAVEETGGAGHVVNAPLAPATGGAEMRAVYDEVILPAVEAFAPGLILVSAGFDAHARDPLAQLNWRTDDFAWLTARICDVADRVCAGRIVSTLEGGYDLDALGESVAAHVGVLTERGG